MKRCDDWGQCTRSPNCPPGARHTCNELGVCQRQRMLVVELPAGCDPDAETQPPAKFPFAPGVIDGPANRSPRAVGRACEPGRGNHFSWLRHRLSRRLHGSQIWVDIMKPGAAIQLAQRQRNQELLEYVAEHQPCSFGVLMDRFFRPADYVDYDDARVRFSKRLSYLVNSRQLETTNVRGARRWTLPPVSAESSVDADVACADASDDTWVGTVAAPRQNSVLDGPPYVPDRDCALRAGALDYRTVASRGVRC